MVGQDDPSRPLKLLIYDTKIFIQSVCNIGILTVKPQWIWKYVLKDGGNMTKLKKNIRTQTCYVYILDRFKGSIKKEVEREIA